MAISSQTARNLGNKVLIRPNSQTKGIVSWLTTVDHKRLGIMYLVASFLFLFTATIESALLRTQLIRPDNSFLNPEIFNQM
ncbi:MAG TPA: cytochrome ubiquinol oxidase subunit I, partial [Trueperaceae bacterium]|nr:cytochrome ubiquinol oxidase subunit I [Trueperaceae bacterium]